jgi:PadR family transcriptional regulator PadR
MINDNNESDGNIVRGHINIIILKALSEGDKYGYEIGKYIESKSGGGYKLKQPTLYSSLKRLEDKKLIESYWGNDNVTNGGRRKYFKLTPKGKELSSENLKDWNKSKNLIDKLISDNGTEKTFNVKNENPKIERSRKIIVDSPIYQNIADKKEAKANDVDVPLKPRVQLFSSDDKKDSEYKNILSKLLANVKNDTVEIKKVSDDNTQINQIRFDIPDIKEPALNNKDFENKDFGINEKEQINTKTDYTDYTDKEQYTKENFKDYSGNNYEKLLKEKTYSLLPTSSQFSYGGLDKIKKEMNEQGFNLNPYNDIKKHGKQFLLLNKINLITALLLYMLIVAQTAFIYFYWEPLIKIGLKYYMYILSVFMVIPLVSVLCYIFNPGRKTKKIYVVHNSIISSLMFFAVCVLGVIALSLLFNIDQSSRYEVVLKVIIPLIYASNFVFYTVFWGMLYKAKKCFV